MFCNLKGANGEDGDEEKEEKEPSRGAGKSAFQVGFDCLSLIEL